MSEAATLAPPARAIGELAAALHATTAELVSRLADFDAAEGWRGEGITSCPQWLSVYAGIGHHQAQEMLETGRALRDLPQLSAAFAAGELSLDKVRLVCLVATPADDAMWTEVARQATASQLGRICRGYRQASVVASADQAGEQFQQRSLTTAWQPDGMLRVVALLPPEDGAVVMAALEAATARLAEETSKAEPVSTSLPVEALSPEARRADALVSICDQRLSADGAASTPALMVHVDVAVLTGESSAGRCHSGAGPALALQVAQRLGCDATVVAVTEKDGVSINMGRSRRLVSMPLRRALHVRDRTCAFPGCNVPARRTHAHHIEHWAHGGKTDLDNLVLLCSYHHHRLHEGVVQAERCSSGGLRFRTASGEIIGPVTVGADDLARRRSRFRSAVTAATPAARDATPMNLHWVVGALFDNSVSPRSMD